ncbi:MAG: hypothetical protein QMC36_08380 [Patescibacteria group bacterium]
MADVYAQETRNLIIWFGMRLPQLGQLKMKKSDFDSRLERIPKPWSTLIEEAFDFWRKERKYEVAQNQMYAALFLAINELGLLVLE